MTGPLRRFLPALAIGMVMTLCIADVADARRAGGFGSRGARTYQVPRATETAPRAAAPVERTMTPRTTAQQPGVQQAGAQQPTAAAGAAQARRPGFFGGLGGGLLGGLMLGGLLGMMMGNGFGGAAGMLALLFQAGIIALIAMLVFSFIRRRRVQPQGYAAAGAAPGGALNRDLYEPRAVDPQPLRASAGLVGAPVRTGAGHDEIGVTDKDFDAFERLLGEVQTAFGREDYAALRDLATPEAMSFLVETLAVNAGEGRRNEISDVKLLQGDLSEAWREGDTDYATVAMRFSNIDVLRDRATGAVVEGDPERAVETTEVWSFRRDGGPWGGGWKLSAVQEI
jgi:predicted lipid-binding transport protein (Tim44 family)